MVHDCFKIFQAVSEIKPEPPKSIKIQDKVKRKKQSLIQQTDDNESIFIPLEQNQLIRHEQQKQVTIKKSICTCLPTVYRKQNQIKSTKYLEYLQSVETCPIHGNDVKADHEMQSSSIPKKKVRIIEPQDKPPIEVSQQKIKIKSPEKGILINNKNKIKRQESDNILFNFQDEQQYDIENEIFSTDQLVETKTQYKDQANVFGPLNGGSNKTLPINNVFGPQINKLVNTQEGQNNQQKYNFLLSENTSNLKVNPLGINFNDNPIKSDIQENFKIVNQQINIGQINGVSKDYDQHQVKLDQQPQLNRQSNIEAQQQQPSLVKNEQKIEVKAQGSGIFSQIGQLGNANSISVFGSINQQNQKSSSDVQLGLTNPQKQDLPQPQKSSGIFGNLAPLGQGTLGSLGTQVQLGQLGQLGSLGQLGQLGQLGSLGQSGSQKQNVNESNQGNQGLGINSLQGTSNQTQQGTQVPQNAQNTKQQPSPFSNLGLSGSGNQNGPNNSNGIFGNLGILGSGTLGSQNQTNQQPQLGILGIQGQQNNGSLGNPINLSQLQQSFGQNQKQEIQAQPQQGFKDIFNYTSQAPNINFTNPVNYFNSFDPPQQPQGNQYQLSESRYKNQRTPPKRESTRIE